jgi:hypothetical protein
MTCLEPRLWRLVPIVCRANFNKFQQQITGEHGGFLADIFN